MNKILLAIGISLLLLPIGFQYVTKREQENVIATFEQELKNVSKEEAGQIIATAREYNRVLYEEGVTDRKSYEGQLVFSDKSTDMIGSIEIPKIDCRLPIRKGIESDTLSGAVGHIPETSLPVGGCNTHSVLSGHRGLPGQELLTRLDELEETDIFYVNVGGEQMTYQVCRIQTILPDAVDAVAIEDGRDLVSLVTCTPYGLNTHRLIVTGERAHENVKVEMVSKAHSVSKWNAIPLIVVGSSLAIVLFRMLFHRKKRKERVHEQYRSAASGRRRRKNYLFKNRKHVQRRISAGRRV